MPRRLLRGLLPLPRPPSLPEGPVDVRLDDAGGIETVASAGDPPLAPEPGDEVLSVPGGYLSPGWVDLHVHVYHGGTDISIRPEQAGLARGVTTLLDCGSAGEANFRGLREFVILPAEERVFALLNIGSIGLVACNRVSELAAGGRSVDLARSAAVIEANRDVVRGVKVRASYVITGDWGLEPLRLARKLARMTGLPLMVHVGEPPPLLDEVLDLLSPGDVVTHAYHGKVGGRMTDDAAVLRAAVEARDRGVLFDVGHGAASFSFAVLERALDLGLAPHTISTDLHVRNLDAPVVDLATTASKAMAAGVTLEDAVAAITRRPAAWLGVDPGAEWLRPGAPADLTVFDVVETDLVARDATGEARALRRFVRPRYALRGRRAVEASSLSLTPS